MADLPPSLPRVALGNSGVSVSRIIFGCASIGGSGSARETWGKYGLADSEAESVLDATFAFGIRAVDTAATYAGGRSEVVVGQWLRSRQPDVVVATKVGGLTHPEASPDLSPTHILETLHESLDRLQIESVDMLMTHVPDPATPVGETLEALASLLESGKVRAIGACNVNVGEIEAALDASDRLGLPRYEWVQNEFSLVWGADEDGVIGLCRERGLGYTAHSPLAGGFLTGKYSAGAPYPEGSRLAARPDHYAYLTTTENVAAVERLGWEAKRLGVSTAGLALAWVLGCEGVSAAIVAPRSAEQLAAVQEALELQLDPDQRRRLARRPLA